MKKIAYKLLLCSLAAISAVGCNSDYKYKDYDVDPVTGLTSPVKDYYVELEPGDGKFVTFRWEPAKTESGVLPSYEVVFYPSEGGQEIYRYDAGLDTYTAISHKTMNNIANLAGIDAESEGGDLYWSVIANLGIKQAKASETRKLALSRLSGFSNIPETLYITGSATESEALEMDMMPMKSIGADEGEFEIYTKLDAGGTYNFVGDDGTYYSFSNNIMVEGTSAIAPEKSGIFRIRVDMTTKSITWKEIIKLEYFFPHQTADNEEVPYIGNGVWQLTDKLITFPDSDWDFDERFKFYATVTGEDYEREIWGARELDNPVRPTVLTGEFWYVSITPDVDQTSSYNYTWKYTLECRDRIADLTVYLSPDVENYYLDINLK